MNLELSDESTLRFGFLPESLRGLCVDTFKPFKPSVREIVNLPYYKGFAPRYSVLFGAKPYKYGGTEKCSISTIPTDLAPLFCWALEFGNYNSMLINWYDNGHHYIGSHSDKEECLDTSVPILSVSIGETRVFRVRDLENRVVLDHHMQNHSYILMEGAFQKEYKHEVPKVNGEKGGKLGPRVNVTFRSIK